MAQLSGVQGRVGRHDCSSHVCRGRESGAVEREPSHRLDIGDAPDVRGVATAVNAVGASGGVEM